jgi:hypothetical protein
MIPKALNPSGQVVDEMVAPLLIKIVGPQFTVGFMAGEHMEGTDDDRMGDSHDLPRGPRPEQMIRGGELWATNRLLVDGELMPSC